MPWNLFRSARKLVGRRPAPNALRPRLEALESRLAPSATNVVHYHDDLASTGENLIETTLTTANVNSVEFGKLFSTGVDGQIYAQPLLVSGVSIGGATHNVVFVATEHDSVYAIDADTGAILWQKNYLQAGERTLTVADVGTGDLSPQIGITGTPVIDASTDTIYFVTVATTAASGTTASTSNTVQRLHAVDIATGNEKFGGPVVIAASVNGTGVGNDGHGHVPFDPLRNNQRMGLTLFNGVVYIGWSSHGDVGPYHGWLMGYNASTLQQVAVFNDTPNGTEGGVWESGGALSVDAQGNFYLTTGNGTFDTTLNASGLPNQGDYGDSVLKLAVDPTTSATNQNTNGWGLKVVDYFTPDNEASLDSSDADLGSGGVLILPDAVAGAAHPHLLVTAGKEGRIYLIDRDDMGHFDPSADHVVQEIPNALNSQLGNPAYFNGGIYYATPGFGTDFAKVFSIANGALSPMPTSKSGDTFTWRGGTVSVSADGVNNGIVWALDGGSNELRAYDATNLHSELYTSAQAANNRDQLGTVVKFTVPTVADGGVFVGTSNALVGYGLFSRTPTQTFFVLATNGSLTQNDTAGGSEALSPAGTIAAISAVTDGSSHNDVFAITADRHLWEHTPAGWSLLSTGTFRQISAATNAAGAAVVSGVLTDNSLWENNPAFGGNGWQMLSPAGTILSVSAVTDAAGADTAFAITADTHLWEHTPAGWQMLSSGAFQQVSPGRNGAGQAVVFGVLTDNSLWEDNPAFANAGHWQNLSPAGTILSASAGGPDGVFAITSDHHLWEHAAAGWSLLSTGTFAALSATENAGGQSEVFATLADSSLWQYDPALPGDHWRDLVASGVAFGAASQLL
jgi:PQQ enzyme repeat